MNQWTHRFVGSLLGLGALLAGQSVDGEVFTIPVLPDTQCEINHKEAMFTSQIRWLVDNKAALHIPIVLHVGDIIDWDTPDHRMWEIASKGFAELDAAGIDYALANGNHDNNAVKVGGSAAPGNTNANLRITTEYNHYFPPGRFKLQRGAYEPGKSENAFYTFSAGGVDWLVLVLELWPRQGAIDWAKTVTEAHPQHNVIVLTHSFLNSKGTIKDNNGGYGDTSPQSLFDQLIKPAANVRLVLSGHVDSSAWRIDQGEHGNSVYEILQDYQLEDEGGGYIRLLEVDTEKKTVTARMYSPFYNLTKEDSSKFSFSDVDFIQPKRGGKEASAGRPVDSSSK